MGIPVLGFLHRELDLRHRIGVGLADFAMTLLGNMHVDFTTGSADAIAIRVNPLADGVVGLAERGERSVVDRASHRRGGQRPHLDAPRLNQLRQ